MSYPYRVLDPTTGADTSREFAIPAGATYTISLVTAAGGDLDTDTTAQLLIKNSYGTFNPTGAKLWTAPDTNGEFRGTLVVEGPGNFKVKKSAGTDAIGVEVNQ